MMKMSIYLGWSTNLLFISRTDKFNRMCRYLCAWADWSVASFFSEQVRRETIIGLQSKSGRSKQICQICLHLMALIMFDEFRSAFDSIL